MFSDFPNLHPLVVHLPIVLLLMSVGLQALLVIKDWQQVRWITLAVMGGGFAGAVAASTVFHAMPMGLPARAAAIFAEHEQYAGYTLWLAGITLLLRGVGDYFQIRRRTYESLVLVSALATAGVLSVAGHRGAQLVYVEGVGPKGNLLMKGAHHGHEGMEQMQAIKMDDTESDSHGDGHGDPPPANPSPQPGAGMDDMEGMERAPAGRPATPTAPDGAGSMPGMQMDAPAPRPTRGKAAPANPKMGDMPGMPGMERMDMPGMAPAAPPARTETGKPQPAKAPMAPMPAMAMPPDQPMPGMTMPPAGTKAAAPPAHAMPGMAPMPGMTMPSPMDSFRFEDNNPARRKPPTPKK